MVIAVLFLCRLASLTETARVKGFTISADSNKALAESLNNCVDPQDPSVNTVLTVVRTTSVTVVYSVLTGGAAGGLV